jgi:hypothetical protein
MMTLGKLFFGGCLLPIRTVICCTCMKESQKRMGTAKNAMFTLETEIYMFACVTEMSKTHKTNTVAWACHVQ